MAKMGEEKAAEIVTAIAKRVQRNHPDAEPIGILVAAAATLFLAGYTDPKDRHVLHAAGRMRERLADAPLPPATNGEPEGRTLNPRQQAVYTAALPVWQEIRDRLRASVPESTWRLWIEPLRLCGISAENTLLITGPEGIRAWAERRYSGLLREAAQGLGHEVSAISFVNWVPIGIPGCNSPNGDGKEPPAPNQEVSK